MSTFGWAMELAENPTVPIKAYPTDASEALEQPRSATSGHFGGSYREQGFTSRLSDLWPGEPTSAPHELLYSVDQTTNTNGQLLDQDDEHAGHFGTHRTSEGSSQFTSLSTSEGTRESSVVAEEPGQDYEINKARYDVSEPSGLPSRSGYSTIPLQHPRPIWLRNIEALEACLDVPSPTESQLASDKFEFHRDLSEEEIQAREFGDKALRESLGEVMPDLTRKEQWYAWRKAIQGGRNSGPRSPFGDHPDENTHEQLFNSESHVGNPIRSQFGQELECEDEEDYLLIAQELDEALIDSPAGHSSADTCDGQGISYLEDMKNGPFGNPYAGNARAKYFAITGYDLMDLATRWDQKTSIDPKLREAIQTKAMDKLERFKCNSCRDPLSHSSEDLGVLKQLTPVRQIMYLTWPGPYPVAQLALQDYQQLLEERDEVLETTDATISQLRHLSSERQITRMKADIRFWADFEARMGLLSPAEYDLDHVPEHWLNEAGCSSDPDNFDAKNAYIGPILYPDEIASDECLVNWKYWHGDDLDTQRLKKSLIESIDMQTWKDGSSQDLQKEQYAYLQGLEPKDVEEYYQKWDEDIRTARWNDAPRDFFTTQLQSIFSRWRMPKGYQVISDMQSLSTSYQDPNTAAPLGRSHIHAHMLPLTPESRSTSASSQLPGAVPQETQATTPVPIEPLPIDVIDIGPQDTPKRGLDSTRLADLRQSSPPYTDRSLAPSPSSPISIEAIDTEMNEFLPRSIPQLMRPPKGRSSPINDMVSSLSTSPIRNIDLEVVKRRSGLTLPPEPLWSSPLSESDVRHESCSRAPFSMRSVEMPDAYPPRALSESDSPKTSEKNKARSVSRSPTKSTIRRKSINKVEKKRPTKSKTSRAISTAMTTKALVAAAEQAPPTPKVANVIPATVSTKVKDAVKKIEDAAHKLEGTPTRRSGRIRRMKDAVSREEASVS